MLTSVFLKADVNTNAVAYFVINTNLLTLAFKKPILT